MWFLTSGKAVTEAALRHRPLLCTNCWPSVSVHWGGITRKRKHLLLPRLRVGLEKPFMTTLNQHMHQGQVHSQRGCKRPWLSSSLQARPLRSRRERNQNAQIHTGDRRWQGNKHHAPIRDLLLKSQSSD